MIEELRIGCHWINIELNKYIKKMPNLHLCPGYNVILRPSKFDIDNDKGTRALTKVSELRIN